LSTLKNPFNKKKEETYKSKGPVLKDITIFEQIDVA